MRSSTANLLFAAAAAGLQFAQTGGLTRRALLAMPLLVASPLAARAAGQLVVDKSSRFALTVPDGFVSSKRTATQGTLYVTGNFPRAAVVSVTAWPVTELLAADASGRSLPGMPAATVAPAAALSSLSALAPPEELAKILTRARDREQGGGLISEVASFKLEGDRLLLELTTELPVRQPENQSSHHARASAQLGRGRAACAPLFYRTSCSTAPLI